MKKNILLILLTSLHLSSCMGGSDYYRDRVRPFLEELKPHYKPQMVDGVMEPSVFPDLDEDQKTLVGIDSNHDDVRDDLEIFINRNFKYEYERDIFKAEFRRAPYFFENYKKMSKEELIVQMSNDSEESSCLSYAVGYLKLPESPESRKYINTASLYNTPKRKEILSYIEMKCIGIVYGDGHGDKTIYPNCVKKIEDKYRPKKQ